MTVHHTVKHNTSTHDRSINRRNFVLFSCSKACQLTPWSVRGAQGGNLRQALAADDDNMYAWENRGYGVACDIVSGVCYIHACKVVHRRALCALYRESHCTRIGVPPHVL